ncbi:hypothetical protein IW262DRAFT_1516403 [Armillaria fumosa]|nr:hypothetical protein IW262DRAFT_1516403 [Armillaria fumosa]
MELQKYLESLIVELKATQCKLKSKTIARFLTTNKVSAVIDGYKQRVNDIKADFLVLVTADSRLAISEMQDALVNTVTQATETAQSRMTSTVKAQAHCIRGDVRSLSIIQRDHTAQICEKLQNMKGYYRGQIRELRMGDIYVERLVSPGNVHINFVIKQFNEAADAFMNIKHPNIAQIFGVCRSPNFPATVFHGGTQIPFDDYERNLTATKIIPFYIQLFYDLKSVAEYWSRHSTFVHLLRTPDEGAIHLNEHGQVVVMNRTSGIEFLGGFITCITKKDRISSWASWPKELPASRIHRWSSSLTLRKENLCNAYDAIKHIVWRPNLGSYCPPDQTYAPGSVLTSPGGTLVGRIPIRLDEWVMRWEVSEDSGTIIPLPHLTHNGSIIVPLPYTGTRTYKAEIHLRSFDGMFNSWIAQASQLQSCIYSMGHVGYDGLSLIDPVFYLRLYPETYDSSFCLCDTFMAEDHHHTLSLSIITPSVDYQTNKVSWPILTWYDGDVEISSGEVEEIFSVRLFMTGHSYKQLMSKTLLKTVHDLNANYKFDPGHGGTDICQYFGWPLMEIPDVSTGDWIPLHGSISESASITSNNTYQTSSVTIVSPLDNVREVEHAGEASTKTEIASAMQTRDLNRAMVHGYSL